MGMFNLEERTPLKNHFSSLTLARDYDLNMRKTALVSYQKPGTRVLKECQPGFRLAEIGVNTGLLSFYVGGKMPDATILGVEQNKSLFEVAEESLNLCQWSGMQADIEFELCDFTRLPFDDQSMEIVFSLSSLHQWSDAVAVLKECARICKENGIVIIEDLNRHAEEGFIAFILQFVKEGGDEFMDALRSSYCVEEMRELLREAGLGHWIVNTEDLNLIISSRELTA